MLKHENQLEPGALLCASSDQFWMSPVLFILGVLSPALSSTVGYRGLRMGEALGDGGASVLAAIADQRSWIFVCMALILGGAALLVPLRRALREADAAAREARSQRERLERELGALEKRVTDRTAELTAARRELERHVAQRRKLE